jgi:GrpB-like predicted nucleotidyltransferase (UPF0157 family)
MPDETASSTGLGLAQGIVALADPDPDWPKAYQREAAAIRAALGELALDIQHFGSTAIPGIKAKPIIDILVGVPRFEDGLRCIGPMAGIGYEYAGADIVANDHLFGKGVVRTHLAHVVEHGGANWRRNLLFRDRLRADPSLVRAYEALKMRLALRHANSRAAYTAAKQDFITEAIR